MAEASEVLKLLRQAKVDEALELADKVDDKKGLAAKLTHFAGTLDWLKGKSHASGLILAKAIELDPDYAPARYNLAVVCTDLELLSEDEEYLGIAELEYRKSIKLDPSFAPAHYNLALLYYFTGRFGKSREEYEKAVKIDPHESKFKDLGFLLENAVDEK